MSEDEIKLFPQALTFFTTKKDATYDGDPEGDYVLAEHMNKVQEAINRIEKSIGTFPSSQGTVSENIKILKNERPMRVDSVGYFTGTLSGNTSAIQSALSQYHLVLLDTVDLNTKGIVEYLSSQGIDVFGVVDAREPLNSIQNNASNWKNQGAKGILLNHFGGEEAPVRVNQQRIIDSISQEEMQVAIAPVNINDLIDDSVKESYNPTGSSFSFPENTIIQLRPFAYSSDYQTTEQLTQTVQPLVQSLKQRGLQIVGWSNATTQEQFEYVQGSALLFSLNYLYNGNPVGETVSTQSPLFSWPSLFSSWETELPIVFSEAGSVVRRVKNGSIRVNNDYTVELSGLEFPSTLIEWVQNTIPGSALKEGSIHPDKLSTYDIQRIVNLLNDAPEEIQIDATRIKMDEGGLGLPINIPPSNMQQNVIQAINQKNNENTLELRYIEDSSIKSISATKITGDIEKDQMVGQVVEAINEASNQDVFISVPKASITDLRSTGTIQGNILTGDNFTFRQGQLTEGLTTEDLRVNGYLEGNDGEFLSLYIQNLEVETLSGLENLDVTNLTAESMSALVGKIVELEADHAQIGSLVSNTISTGSLNTELITAINSITDLQITNSGIFGDAVIDSASIKQIDASKITTGSIDTDQVTLSSKDGHLTIESSHLRIYSGTDSDGNRRLRTAIGYVGDLVSTEEINLNTLKELLSTKKKDLVRASESEKPSIQSEIDSLQIEINSLEEDIANLPYGYEDELYGLVVMGDDGETRLFDHTGVYSAGIKDNAISNEKLQEDAIDDSVIRVGGITARSIQAETITGDLIAGKTITASEKLVAKSIVGELIQADAIEAGHIQTGAITADKIIGGAIAGHHIQANAIDSEKLTIGFNANKMNMGFDSFEQEVLGRFTGILESLDQVTLTWPNGEETTTDFIQDNKWRITKPSSINLSPGEKVTVKQNINGQVRTTTTTVYDSSGVPPNEGSGELTIEPVSNRSLVLQGKAKGSVSRAEVTSDWFYEGRYSLSVEGNQSQNMVRLGTQHEPYPLAVFPGEEYFLSVYTWSGRQSSTPVRIGLKIKDGDIEWSPVLNVAGGVRPTRLSHKFTIPEDTLRVAVVLSVEASNSLVYFDAVQFEEIEEGKLEPGSFKPTATTVISGDNITTGRIDARHIHIGEGSVFGNGDVIDITDEGIIARSTSGQAMLNSKGLEITGGAFHLTSGTLGEKSFSIADGVLTAETPLNLIEIDPDRGFSIISKKNKQILFDTDPNTGEIRMSGTFKVYSKDNPEMAWTVEDKFSEIESEIENIELTPGPSGLTAYEVAVSEGFKGTQNEWINSLVGEVGPSGKTPYELALEEGFKGTQEDWLNSLVGKDGEDSYSSSLSNDNHTINTDSDGEHGFYEGAESTLTIYKGNKNDTHNWTISVEEGPGISGEFDTETKTYKLRNINLDSSRVIFKASKEGQEDIIKVFTLNRLKAAKKGEDAVTYLLNLDTFYLRKDREEGTITPSEFSVKGLKSVGGSAPGMDKGYFVVYEQLEESITIDNYTDMVYKSLVELEKEYIISGVDFPYVKRYQSMSSESEIVLTPSANILKLHIEWYEDEELTILRDVEQIPVVSDGLDTYSVEINSLNGDTFKNGIIDTWLYATVYKGDKDVTSEIEERRFEWTRISTDEKQDRLWNDRYYGGRKEIKITHEDVYKRATFTCSIRKQ